MAGLRLIHGFRDAILINCDDFYSDDWRNDNRRPDERQADVRSHAVRRSRRRGTPTLSRRTGGIGVRTGHSRRSSR